MTYDCEYCKDEICVNDKCPICCDYCPVVDYEGVCKHELRPDENVVALFESEKIAEPTIKCAVEFCKKSSVGTHVCSVKTQFGWCCDICLEDELLYLASEGVHTVNSCCGHGNDKLSTILVAGETSKEKMKILGYEFVGDVSERFSEWSAKSKTIWEKYSSGRRKGGDE